VIENAMLPKRITKGASTAKLDGVSITVKITGRRKAKFRHITRGRLESHKEIRDCTLKTILQWVSGARGEGGPQGRIKRIAKAKTLK